MAIPLNSPSRNPDLSKSNLVFQWLVFSVGLQLISAIFCQTWFSLTELVSQPFWKGRSSGLFHWGGYTGLPPGLSLASWVTWAEHPLG